IGRPPSRPNPQSTRKRGRSCNRRTWQPAALASAHRSARRRGTEPQDRQLPGRAKPRPRSKKITVSLETYLFRTIGHRRPTFEQPKTPHNAKLAPPGVVREKDAERLDGLFERRRPRHESLVTVPVGASQRHKALALTII